MNKYAKRLLYFQEKSRCWNRKSLAQLVVILEKKNKRNKNIPNLLMKLHALGDIEATYSLAWRYCHGVGVQKDLHKAFQLYTKCSANGNTRALYNLALMYKNGTGIEQDDKQAMSLFDKLVAMNYWPALYQMALYYYEGKAINQDLEKAKDYVTQFIDSINDPFPEEDTILYKSAAEGLVELNKKISESKN